MVVFLPTAETAIINYHRGEILDYKDLPKNIFLILLVIEEKQEVIVLKKEEQ